VSAAREGGCPVLAVTPRIARPRSAHPARSSKMDKLERVLNSKTSKALGLTMPQSVLARADKVFQ